MDLRHDIEALYHSLYLKVPEGTVLPLQGLLHNSHKYLVILVPVEKITFSANKAHLNMPPPLVPEGLTVSMCSILVCDLSEEERKTMRSSRV